MSPARYEVFSAVDTFDARYWSASAIHCGWPLRLYEQALDSLLALQLQCFAARKEVIPMKIKSNVKAGFESSPPPIRE
jgi:hypothetical protein